MTLLSEKLQRLVILGAGPAGLSAAIYASRASLDPVCIEGSQPGGQLMITSEVENYPGFAQAVLGPELMAAFRAQAERFGTRFLQDSVVRVDLRAFPFVIEMGEGVIQTQGLVIATGASAKWLGIPSEKQWMGKGVSACATCDGFFFKGLDIAVVGGGDTAMEEATFLTRFARSVVVIHRRDHLRASKAMQEKAMKHPKIRFIWNAAIETIVGDQSVSGVVLRDLNSQKLSELKVQGVFVAIGHQPNTSLFQDFLPCDAHGYLMRDPNSTRTQIPGVFVAGDVCDPVYRQAVTAAGMGCMAAIDAERFLGI